MTYVVAYDICSWAVEKRTMNMLGYPFLWSTETTRDLSKHRYESCQGRDIWKLLQVRKLFYWKWYLKVLLQPVIFRGPWNGASLFTFPCITTIRGNTSVLFRLNTTRKHFFFFFVDILTPEVKQGHKDAILSLSCLLKSNSLSLWIQVHCWQIAGFITTLFS